VHHYDLTQTLTTLDLSWNKVGEEGAQYLANALQSNNVRYFFVLINYISVYGLTQTLVSLDLIHNNISFRGLQYFVEALQINKVVQFLFASIMYSSFLFNIDTHDVESSIKLYQS
jgi:uncharacterized membrane protein